MNTLLILFQDNVMLACIIAITVVCAFEFINGFHDTANAVATVIYTKTLKPIFAIVWSGLWNFLGVYIGGVAVAMSIMNVVPLHDLAVHGTQMSLIFVGCVLIASIIRNLLTRYLGIPCSSSHTLIGAMIGASLGFFWYYDGAGVDRTKLGEIGLSLLISPLFGFGIVVLLLTVIHKIREKEHPSKEKIHDRKMHRGIRAILITTCGLVSFSHGSNDGQKGVGLIMMILISTFPAIFSFNSSLSHDVLEQTIQHIQQVTTNIGDANLYETIEKINGELVSKTPSTFGMREELRTLQKELRLLIDGGTVSLDQKQLLAKDLKTILPYTDYAPVWVILLISCSLGLGTMIGRKRIVVTIGEKIGKTHLTYVQGAVSEIVAASTIGLSTRFGLPVSTTHVLSSAIAGSMVATGGVKNIQKDTIMHIVIARVLTVPVSIALAYILFLGAHTLRL